MSGSQSKLRIRNVQYFQRIWPTKTDWKRATVRHFMAEGVLPSTIYRLINIYLATGSTKHKKGAWRPRMIMTSLARTTLTQRNVYACYHFWKEYGCNSCKSYVANCLETHLIPFLNRIIPEEGISFGRTRQPLIRPGWRPNSSTRKVLGTSKRRIIWPKFYSTGLLRTSLDCLLHVCIKEIGIEEPRKLKSQDSMLHP